MEYFFGSGGIQNIRPVSEISFDSSPPGPLFGIAFVNIIVSNKFCLFSITKTTQWLHLNNLSQLWQERTHGHLVPTIYIHISFSYLYYL